MNVQLESFTGYTGTPLTALGSGKIAYPWATGVAFQSVSGGDPEFWAPGDGTHEISAMCVNQQNTLLVCAERRLKPSLLVYSHPDRAPLQRIPEVCSLSVADMAFSRDGKLFAILSGAPHYQVSLYTVDFQNKFTLVHKQKEPSVHQFSSISFNPKDAHQYCTSGGGHIMFSTFDPQSNTVNETEGRVQTSGVRLSSHAWLPSGDVVGGCHSGELFIFDTKSAVGKVMFDASDEGSVVKIVLTKHHMLVSYSTGLIRFMSHDGRTVEKSVHLKTKDLTTFSIMPEWHTFAAGGSDGYIELIHVPGYENVALSAEQFSLTTPKTSVVAGFGGAPIGGVVHAADSYAIRVLWNNGVLGSFDYSTNTLLGKIHLGEHAPTVCGGGVGPSKNFVLTGHADGVIRVVNVTDSCNMEIAFRAKISTTAITVVSINESGDTFAVSDGTNLMFLRVQPDIDVIATVPLNGSLQHLCWMGQLGLLLGFKNGEVQHINVPDSVSIEADTLTASIDYLSVNSWKLDYPVVKMTAPCVFDEVIHLFVLSVDKETKLYVIDRTLPADRKDKDTKPCKPHFTVRDHEKTGTDMAVFKEKWLASSATDGRVVIRDITQYLQRSATMPKDARKDTVVQTSRHVPLKGGVKGFCFSGDHQRIVSVGGDSTAIVWTAGKVQKFSHQPFALPADESDLVPDQEETLMYADKLKKRAEELDFLQHEKHRQAIQEAVARLRERLQAIRVENDDAADDEKVELKDFLIERQQATFMEECEKAIDEMKDRIRWENVNRDYVIDTIRRECWDVMDIKLTPLVSLNTPGLVVHNFHTMREDKKDLQLLQKLKFMRRMQDVDRTIRNVSELDDIFDGEETAAEEPASPSIETAFEAPDEQTKLPSLEVSSRADVSEFLYKPMLVFTRNRAIIQMNILGGRIRNIKHDFNMEFNELVERKKADIQRIEERNVRCRQVLKELEQTQDLFSPAMQSSENPSLILDVKDDEVAADKTTDPDEKARLAQEAADYERWKARHGNDDSSDRALKAWMDGRLEKEIRVLEIKVDKPDFADENSEKFVPLDERTDEQTKLVAEYEKKLAKRIEEVNARRKSLQTELVNLQKDNKETAAVFDKLLVALLSKRLNCSSKCDEVELQQVKLAQGMIIQQERQKIAVKMEEQRAELEDKVRVARQAADIANRDLNTRHERLEQLLADEKMKQKNMRQIPPFSDSEEFAEMLYKLYMKKKARKDKPGQGANKADKKGKAKAEATSESMDPFAFIEREEEQKRRQQAAEDAIPLPRIDRPESVPDALWDAFQNFRQDRLDAERDSKRMEEEIAEKTKEVERLQEILDEVEEASAESIRQANAFHMESLREQYDLDELHVFKQGQVEVEQQPVVTDYADAILINKSRIERLNALIKASGKEKVEKLREINNKRKEIRLIDWEIEHLQYCMRNLEMEYRHLHTLRVTKQMQEFINGGGEDHNEMQRMKLLKKINHVQESMSLKIQERQNQMLKLRRMIKEKDLENQVLLGQVGDAKTTVDDRRSIRDLQSSELDVERTDRLMRDMRVTRKLEDVAKAQQEEMVALKKEIDRLRARTFPSFAVVSKRVVGNPDQQ